MIYFRFTTSGLPLSPWPLTTVTQLSTFWSMFCPTSHTPSCSAPTPSPTSCGGSWCTWAPRQITVDTGASCVRVIRHTFDQTLNEKIPKCGLDFWISTRFPWYPSYEIYGQLWICWGSGLPSWHKSINQQCLEALLKLKCSVVSRLRIQLISSFTIMLEFLEPLTF